MIKNFLDITLFLNIDLIILQFWFIGVFGKPYNLC